MLPGLMMDYPLTLGQNRRARRAHDAANSSSKRNCPMAAGTNTAYADFAARVKKLGNLLAGLGVESGDRVGTFAWNNYQHLECYFGIPAAGAVCHTLNIRLSAEQLKFIIEHAGDKIIIVDGTLLPLLEPIAGQLDMVEHFLLFNCDESALSRLPRAALYEDLMAEASDDFVPRCTDENMAMGLCYTSGTTGLPKGVLYSHRSMMLHTLGVLAAAAIGSHRSRCRAAGRAAIPRHGLGLPYACAWAGATMIMPGPHLQPAPLAEMIESERVTIAAGVPTIWNGLYHELRANPRDISCITQLVVGGSAMPRGLIAAYERELGVNVVHAWGMTELSADRHCGPSCNRAMPTWTKKPASISKPSKAILCPGSKRESWTMQALPCPGMAKPWASCKCAATGWPGQYFRIEHDEEHFTPDGWFRTGDVCTIDENGYMTITDRTKDLVKSGGEWISSVDLENALMSQESVREAAVIAVPDARWGERPLAVLVPLADSCDHAELNEWPVAKFSQILVARPLCGGQRDSQDRRGQDGQESAASDACGWGAGHPHPPAPSPKMREGEQND